MNDQRQVIFSQRLKILKEKNTIEILNDFFEDVLNGLKLSVSNYNKSNDEKYLTEIKNVTGNSIKDEKLVKISLNGEERFFKEMRYILEEKRKSRVSILGQDQNESLEKKIFLQVIDYSWRSHLQYLEQLRQVIGLRQYGQKDPLSEFKKEAFILFESLLAKIKIDLVKILLNLDIVVNSKENNETKKENMERNDEQFKKVGRNEKCPCGSGKKFKLCHGNV